MTKVLALTIPERETIIRADLGFKGDPVVRRRGRCAAPPGMPYRRQAWDETLPTV